VAESVPISVPVAVFSAMVRLPVRVIAVGVSSLRSIRLTVMVCSTCNATFNLIENTSGLFSLTGTTLTFNGATTDFESNTKSYTAKVKATTGGAIFPTEVNNLLGQPFIITSNEGTLIGGDWVIIICCSYGEYSITSARL
jgi:hypothetical protein